MTDAEVVEIIDAAAIEIADVMVFNARTDCQNNTSSLAWTYQL